MQWTGSKCMFRTAAAQIERTSEAWRESDCFIFSALIFHNVHIHFNFVSLMKSPENDNAAFLLGDSLPLLLNHIIVKGF